MERKEWRRFIAVILSVLMVVGIINIPTDVVRAESDEYYTITYDGNGGYTNNVWDDEQQMYVSVEQSETSVVKGDEIGDSYCYPYERTGYIFAGYKLKNSDTLYVAQDKYNYDIQEGEAYLSDYVPTGDVTFYAQWKECYEITVNANGGWMWYEWNDELQEEVPAGETYTLKIEKGSCLDQWIIPNNNPGLVFKGFKIEGDSSNTLYVFKSEDELEEGEALYKNYIPTKDVTLIAQWVKGSAVTYDANGGCFDTEWDDEVGDYVDITTTLYNVEGKIKSNWTEPNARDGYIFKGYKIDGDDKLYVTENKDYYDLKDGEAFLSEYVPTEDVTFKAQWAESCEITYDGNGGYISEKWDEEAEEPELITTEIYETEKGVRLGGYFPLPCREGYDFKGYKLENSDVLYVINSEDSYELKDGEAFLSEYVPTGDVTFYAQWDEYVDDSLDLKVDPGEGYIYNEMTGEKDYGIHDVKDYVPSWRGYHSGDYLSLSIESRMPGKVFDGWKSKLDGKVYKPYYMIQLTEDDVFSAQYSEGVVVALDLNGGYYSFMDGPMSNNSYYCDPWFKASEAGKISVEGYRFATDETGKAFAGWKKAGDDKLYSTEDLNKMTFTDDTTFVAQWTDAYTVTFYSEEGYMRNYSEEEQTYTVSVTKNKKFDGRIPVRGNDFVARYGYLVDYWTLDGDDTKYHDADILDMVIDKNLVFTAHWRNAPKITYKANGGKISDGPVQDDQFERYCAVGGSPVKMNVFRDGYVLDGWLVEDDSALSGSVIADLTTYVVRGDVTLTAQWGEYDPDNYCTVKYDPNGGWYNHVPPSQQYKPIEDQYKKGTIIKLIGPSQINRPYKEDSELIGWTIEGGDGKVLKPCELIDGEFVGGDYTVTGDVTFVAVWDDAKINITYKTEDGNFGLYEDGTPMKTVTERVDPDEPIVSYLEPKCDGKLFIGYQIDGTDDILYTRDYLVTIGENPDNYDTIDDYAPTQDVTLIALWESEVYTITFESNGGVDGAPYEVIDTIYAKKGATIPEYLWAETDEKKEFVGYTIKGDTSGTIYKKGKAAYDEGGFFSIVPTGDMTFTAVFADAYYVTVDYDGAKSTIDDQTFNNITLAFEKDQLFPEKDWFGDELENLYKDDYELAGWIIVDDPSEKVYESAGDIKVSRDMTIKPKWVHDCEKLGHIPVIDPAVDATTEKTGLTEGSHCSVCGAVIKKQEVVPKKVDPEEEARKKAEEEAKKKAEEEAKKKAEEEAKKKAEEEAKKKAEEEAKKKAEEEAKKKAEEEAKKNAKTEYSSEWVDGKWYDESGVNSYSGVLSWKSDEKGWWVEDTDDWYPADKWQKIDGIWYYFKPDGYMATDEYYNGYWFNSDGSWDPQYNLQWMSNATGWWVEDISGWWPADSWLKIDGCWYYFDGSGYMVSNQYVDGWWIDADGVCR